MFLYDDLIVSGILSLASGENFGDVTGILQLAGQNREVPNECQGVCVCVCVFWPAAQFSRICKKSHVTCISWPAGNTSTKVFAREIMRAGIFGRKVFWGERCCALKIARGYSCARRFLRAEIFARGYFVAREDPCARKCLRAKMLARGNLRARKSAY